MRKMAGESKANNITASHGDQELEVERETWLTLSPQGLAAAYDDDEPEYPVTLVKEHNPEYERG
jgi:hypothetical protein